MLFELHAESVQFPSPELALTEPDGLLAFSGDLSVERLVAAYHNGIFPWYGEQDPILWWSPNPRTVFSPNSLHISRSMRRFLKRTPLRVTINQAFEQVITACSSVHNEAGRGIWIHAEMIKAYVDLHQHHHAHSVEVWHDQTLVGGLYGVAANRVFCAESMFHTVSNASKLALIVFAQNFFANNGLLIDAQIANAHTESLGAQALPRTEYLQQLRVEEPQLRTNFWTPRTLKA